MLHFISHKGHLFLNGKRALREFLRSLPALELHSSPINSCALQALKLSSKPASTSGVPTCLPVYLTHYEHFSILCSHRLWPTVWLFILTSGLHRTELFFLKHPTWRRTHEKNCFSSQVCMSHVGSTTRTQRREIPVIGNRDSISVDFVSHRPGYKMNGKGPYSAHQPVTHSQLQMKPLVLLRKVQLTNNSWYIYLRWEDKSHHQQINHDGHFPTTPGSFQRVLIGLDNVSSLVWLFLP